jgi:hypothetical protein
VNKSVLYRLVYSLYLHKIEETQAQKQAVFDLIFSAVEENANLGWVLAESMGLNLEADLQQLSSNLIRSNSYHYFYNAANLKAAFDGFPGGVLSKLESIDFYNIATLSPLIRYCHQLKYLTIRPNAHQRYGYWRKKIRIEQGMLKALPQEIGELNELEYLQISRQPIERLPEEITALKALKRLIITNTNLKELPKAIGKLENLEFLILANNKIQELPQSLLNLQQLKIFQIKDNPLNWDKIPVVFRNPNFSPKAIYTAFGA